MLQPLVLLIRPYKCIHQILHSRILSIAFMINKSNNIHVFSLILYWQYLTFNWCGTLIYQWWYVVEQSRTHAVSFTHALSLWKDPTSYPCRVLSPLTATCPWLWLVTWHPRQILGAKKNVHLGLGGKNNLTPRLPFLWVVYERSPHSRSFLGNCSRTRILERVFEIFY